jgi:putative membrane protein insertion efficiency factor
MKRFLIACIDWYKRDISPSLKPRCRFYPTCSLYAREAIESHGSLKGSFLALRRLLKCNPLFKGGYDPVPVIPKATGITNKDKERTVRI